MNYWLFILPFISAAIGWGIQRLAIKYLFYPQQPKNFVGLTFQGVFPKRQRALGRQLGKLAQQELASFDIQAKVSDPAHFEKLMPLLEVHIDDFLRNKLKEQMPMISMFIGDKTIQTLKTVFMQELQKLFPQVINQFAANIKSDIDVEKIVAEKIAIFPPERLEQILAPFLRMFALSGAIAGFLIGLVQVLVTLIFFT